MEKLYTIKETMEYLRISRGTFYNWMKQGKISVVEFNGKTKRVPESELKRLTEIKK